MPRHRQKESLSVNVLDQRSYDDGGSDLGPARSMIIAPTTCTTIQASLSVASDAQCASPSFRAAATQLTAPVIAVVGRMWNMALRGEKPADAMP
jgi:hypothetical protein